VHHGVSLLSCVPVITPTLQLLCEQGGRFFRGAALPAVALAALAKLLAQQEEPVE
jgi:hypothetical protein